MSRGIRVCVCGHVESEHTGSSGPNSIGQWFFGQCVHGASTVGIYRFGGCRCFTFRWSIWLTLRAAIARWRS